MHDVLDPRDLVPDEADQLASSGFPAAELAVAARIAAAAGDLAQLAEIEAELATLQRDPGWPHVEPTDETELLAIAGAVEPRAPVPGELADRLHGAWLGRAVGNTLGKPVEGLTRGEVETYLRA